jgi:hypothetical protein
VHRGRFGNDCQNCHNENSFKNVKILQGFDHSKTNFPLLGKHKDTGCEKCHKGSLITKPAYAKCYNCHEDYHKGEFIKNNVKTDCVECHSEQGFSPSLFSISQHSNTNFPLKFSHAATPCTSCHLIESEWKFRIDGGECILCHNNSHGSRISEKFFNNRKCENCHSEWSWQIIDFDHQLTSFPLMGKHLEISCSKCHYRKNGDNVVTQHFKDLNRNCLECHTDIHFGQFVIDGYELCNDCHTFNNWEPTLFDHNKTKFKLEGAHIKLSCYSCHKKVEIKEGNYILYKIKDISCKSCHS